MEEQSAVIIGKSEPAGITERHMNVIFMILGLATDTVDKDKNTKRVDDIRNEISMCIVEAQ